MDTLFNWRISLWSQSSQPKHRGFQLDPEPVWLGPKLLYRSIVSLFDSIRRLFCLYKTEKVIQRLQQTFGTAFIGDPDLRSSSQLHSQHWHLSLRAASGSDLIHLPLTMFLLMRTTSIWSMRFYWKVLLVLSRVRAAHPLARFPAPRCKLAAPIWPISWFPGVVSWRTWTSIPSDSSWRISSPSQTTSEWRLCTHLNVRAELDSITNHSSWCQIAIHVYRWVLLYPNPSYMSSLTFFSVVVGT